MVAAAALIDGGVGDGGVVEIWERRGSPARQSEKLGLGQTFFAERRAWPEEQKLTVELNGAETRLSRLGITGWARTARWLFRLGDGDGGSTMAWVMVMIHGCG
ncbi:hypothetical protein M0R45_009263 [Rubus argutus]|uniref:Uncharacterized protein n=1 Tax=Rubus argutus TaxID=59490 RepID=A0AAW1Y5I9_RUBAR